MNGWKSWFGVAILACAGGVAAKGCGDLMTAGIEEAVALARSPKIKMIADHRASWQLMLAKHKARDYEKPSAELVKLIKDDYLKRKDMLEHPTVPTPQRKKELLALVQKNRAMGTPESLASADALTAWLNNVNANNEVSALVARIEKDYLACLVKK